MIIDHIADFMTFHWLFVIWATVITTDTTHGWNSNLDEDRTLNFRLVLVPESFRTQIIRLMCNLIMRHKLMPHNLCHLRMENHDKDENSRTSRTKSKDSGNSDSGNAYKTAIKAIQSFRLKTSTFSILVKSFQKIHQELLRPWNPNWIEVFHLRRQHTLIDEQLQPLEHLDLISGMFRNANGIILHLEWIKTVEKLTENYNRDENQFHVNDSSQFSHVIKNQIPKNFAYRNFRETRGFETNFRFNGTRSWNWAWNLLEVLIIFGRKWPF